MGRARPGRQNTEASQPALQIDRQTADLAPSPRVGPVGFGAHWFRGPWALGPMGRGAHRHCGPGALRPVGFGAPRAPGAHGAPGGKILNLGPHGPHGFPMGPHGPHMGSHGPHGAPNFLIFPPTAQTPKFILIPEAGCFQKCYKNQRKITQHQKNTRKNMVFSWVCLVWCDSPTLPTGGCLGRSRQLLVGSKQPTIGWVEAMKRNGIRNHFQPTQTYFDQNRP